MQSVAEKVRLRCFMSSFSSASAMATRWRAWIVRPAVARYAANLSLGVPNTPSSSVIHRLLANTIFHLPPSTLCYTVSSCDHFAHNHNRLISHHYGSHPGRPAQPHLHARLNFATTAKMSEPIPESIPTSADPRSKRPTKKRALTPRTAQASQVDALFAKPDRDIHIPGSSLAKGQALPPEIVANVQGSSAGAGSGEFHVYKASRRREYERLRMMDEEVQKEEDEKEFAQRKEELEKRDKEKTEKNRLKREKARLRKEKAKKGGKGGNADSERDGIPVADGEKTKKKLAPNANELKHGAGKDAEDNNEGGEVKNVEEIGLIIEDDD